MHILGRGGLLTNPLGKFPEGGSAWQLSANATRWFSPESLPRLPPIPSVSASVPQSEGVSLTRKLGSILGVPTRCSFSWWQPACLTHSFFPLTNPHTKKTCILRQPSRPTSKLTESCTFLSGIFSRPVSRLI